MAHYEPYDVPESALQQFNDFNLRVKYDVGGVSIQSITSEIQVNSFINEDDAESQYFAFGPLGPNGFATNNYTTEKHNSNQFNEELRLTSNYESKIQWVVGGFYSSFSDTQLIANTVNDLIPVFGTNNAFTDYEVDTLTQQALFGEINYQFLPELKATAGLRYFHYRNTFSQNATGLAAQTGLYSGVAGAYGLTPKFTLTYTPDKDLLVYGTVSKGYRPGGPNLPIPTSGLIDCTSSYQQLGLKTEPSSFGPDSVWNYEIGEKAKLFDGNVTMNGSLYYIDWSKMQLQTTLACGYYFTGNSGNAFSEGGEAEITAKLGHGLKLMQSVGLTRAALSSLSLPGNTAVGQQLPDVPRWTFATSLEWSHDLNSELTLTALASNRFVDGEYDYSSLPYNYTHKPSYDLVDLRVGLLASSWSASLYVNNVTDRRAILGINRDQSQNNPYYTRLFVSQPRTIGVTAETEF
jgi:outer membrane receptor protein involved in Fe transport